jgi:hypothetical protein
MKSISINGNMFFAGSARWSPKGIAYQPQDGVDPLSDDNLATIQSLLAPEGNFTKLQINALRVYQVEPTRPHNQVMDLLAARGIYVLVGCVNKDTAIPRNATGVPSRTVERVKQVVDAFADYPNVLGFNISNELLDSADSSQYPLPGIVKQVAARAREYLSKQGKRAIPIGAATRDDPTFTIAAAKAYACGADKLDYLAYNSYRWAGGDLTGRMIAYQTLYDQFGEDYPIPAFLGEYGAVVEGKRDFSQVPYLFGQKLLTANGRDLDLSATFSGGFAFRYHQRNNEDFGLVDDEGQPRPDHGFQDLAANYGAITSFQGTPRHTSYDCSKLSGNPYAGGAPQKGGLPSPITINVTNEFVNPQREIAVTYQLAGSAEWQTVVTLPKGSATVQATLPAGTETVQVVYHDEASGQWYQGCGIEALQLDKEVTLVGQWCSPDGKGPCLVRKS